MNFCLTILFCVLYVKALWDKTLEFRFLLQKPFSSSNRLPQVSYLLFILVCVVSLISEGNDFQETVKSSFCSEDEKVSTAYSELITSSKKTLDSLLELQEVCMRRYVSSFFFFFFFSFLLKIVSCFCNRTLVVALVCCLSLYHFCLTLLKFLQALFEKNPSVDQQANGTESNKSDAEDSDE